MTSNGFQQQKVYWPHGSIIPNENKVRMGLHDMENNLSVDERCIEYRLRHGLLRWRGHGRVRLVRRLRSASSKLTALLA